jgi:hypothetical protein
VLHRQKPSFSNRFDAELCSGCGTGLTSFLILFLLAEEVTAYLDNYKDLDLGNVVTGKDSIVKWTEIKKSFDKQAGNILIYDSKLSQFKVKFCFY